MSQPLVILTMFYRVDKGLILVTWTSLRPIQDGVRGGWVTSNDSGATYAILDWSEWRPSNQNQSLIQTLIKKITHFRQLSCQNLDTWPPPRAAHGGVRAAIVIRRHPAAMYATLDWSEWRPSHQNQSLIHTIKHRQNNQGLRHFLHYFLRNISPQYSLQHGKTVKK